MQFALGAVGEALAGGRYDGRLSRDRCLDCRSRVHALQVGGKRRKRPKVGADLLRDGERSGQVGVGDREAIRSNERLARMICVDFRHGPLVRRRGSMKSKATKQGPATKSESGAKPH